MITYDFIAIGLGPFNLGLACLSDPIHSMKGLFLEKKSHFDWHPGMLLNDATLQVPFMADLVTLADPTSKFSFLNYLKQKGRIYSFYIKENFLILRKEYNEYCRWVISQLENIKFQQEVTEIDFIEEEQIYVISILNKKTNTQFFYRARKIILGTGSTPHLPTCCNSPNEELIHSAFYLNHKANLQSKKSITVVGSGQSAAEIFYDLLKEMDEHEYSLNWTTRSPRFFPLEYTKLTLEMTSPEYIDYFHQLSSSKRDELLNQQRGLYKGINQDLIAEIYDLLYFYRNEKNHKIQLRTNSALIKIEDSSTENNYQLILHQKEQDKYYKLHSEAVVFATGFKYAIPSFLENIQHRINWDSKQRYAVNRNYSIDQNGTDIFVQNAEIHTHGFTAPDLGMGCYRNSYIIKELTGEDHYPIEKRIAFQQFGVKDEEEVFLENLKHELI